LDRPDVSLLRAGVLAQEFCRRGGLANVEAVFERSFYLRSGAQFICVGEPSVGNGPLTLIGPTGFLSGLALRPNRPACVSDGQITIDRVRLTLDECEPWRPPPWPSRPQLIQLIGLCATLTRRAAAGAPEEGLARYVFGAAETRGLPSLARIAQPRIAAFECALSGMLGDEQVAAIELEKSVRGLLGLGPGLTPSGDDVLVGALALLDALGEKPAHAALAQTIIALSSGLTAPLSCCFLRAAAAGHIGETLHGALSSILAGEIDAAIAAAETIGHCSGWDMLAVIAIALRSVAAAWLAGKQTHVS